MTATTARKQPASASASLRPKAHQQFRLLPVVLPHQPAWNKRVARWAGARG
jgi:hypothetical protein